MKTGQNKKRIGLVVRSGPFTGRSARDQLDLALTAATLDYDLDLFFTGAGVLQLLADHDPHAAGLPKGSKGWKSLPTLTGVRAFITPVEWQRSRDAGQNLLLDVSPLDPGGMASLIARCRRVLVV